MQTAFQIQSENKKDGLHLTLKGDFDGNSAYELINKLKQNAQIGKIFINTEKLKRVHPFGCSVWEKHFPFLNGKGNRLIFAGAKKSALLSGFRYGYAN